MQQKQCFLPLPKKGRLGGPIREDLGSKKGRLLAKIGRNVVSSIFDRSQIPTQIISKKMLQIVQNIFYKNPVQLRQIMDKNCGSCTKYCQVLTTNFGIKQSQTLNFAGTFQKEIVMASTGANKTIIMNQTKPITPQPCCKYISLN